MEWNSTNASLADLLLDNTTGCNRVIRSPAARPTSLVLMTWGTEVAICLPVACLGVVGNLLAFAVLCAYKQKQSTTVYLQALALSDTVYLLLAIFLRNLMHIGRYMSLLSYPYAYRWGYPLSYTVRLFSMWLTILVTMDRCEAVRNPLLASRFAKTSKAYVHIAAVALASLAFSVVRFFEVEVIVYNGCPKLIQRQWVKDEIYILVYRIFAFFLVMYFIPLIILISANCVLMRSLKHANEKRNELQAHLAAPVSLARVSSITNAGSITKIVVTIVIISICSSSCAGVAHVMWALHTCYVSLRHIDVARRYIAAISNLLVTFNSAVNFVVYCLWSRKFRVVAAETLQCRTCRWRCNKFVRRSLRRRSQSSMESADTKLTNLNV